MSLQANNNEIHLGVTYSNIPIANTTENILYDNVDNVHNFGIADCNTDVNNNQEASFSGEIHNFANVSDWNFNSVSDMTSAPLDPFMNFQNFASFEANANSGMYFQGLMDGIDFASNFSGQGLNLLAPAPNMIIEQEFTSGELNPNIEPIGRRAIPPAGPVHNNVTPAPRFACNSVGCGKTFGRQGDCDRHMKKHGTFEYSCPEPGCPKQFYRRDKMKDHARRIHSLQL
ncbi:hypothetical protein NHQ30_009830 [Ciborinia camelliae]|nr:hypothetical protein NHQ30_009830 [Ciborinia camelliae]